MTRATLLFESKRFYDDDRIVQARIWIVPKPVLGSMHAFKYSLFYGGKGERLVGYDNEAGKGDHRHFRGEEEAYAFTTVERLVMDFLTDVAALRGGVT